MLNTLDYSATSTSLYILFHFEVVVQTIEIERGSQVLTKRQKHGLKALFAFSIICQIVFLNL
jgi:hypothetical protein